MKAVNNSLVTAAAAVTVCVNQGELRCHYESASDAGIL